jgi:DNA-binding NarL/FixJ family response regulator
MVLAGEAATGHEAIQLSRDGSFNLLLLELALPDMSGMEVLKQILGRDPSARVLIFTGYPEDQYAIRALQAGASGYLTKDCPPAELVRAIRKIAGGGQYVTLSLAEQLVSRLRGGDDRPAHESLSDREYQVMCLLAAGKSVSQAAESLMLSVKSVSTYRSRILEKLKLHTTNEIVRYALLHNLVQ